MRILAIDGSPRRGVVSRSVGLVAAAAQSAGAEVDLVRLADLDIRHCTGCHICAHTGTCKIDDDLPGLAARMADSDGVIFGIPSYFSKADRRIQAVLDRLASYFASDGQLRLPGFSEAQTPSSPVARATKRAIIVTATTTPEPLATFFGYTTGPIRDLRGALGDGGIRTIGSLAVSGTWSRPALDRWECDKATALGGLLAGRV